MKNKWLLEAIAPKLHEHTSSLTSKFPKVEIYQLIKFVSSHINVEYNIMSACTQNR